MTCQTGFVVIAPSMGLCVSENALLKGVRPVACKVLWPAI